MRDMAFSSKKEKEFKKAQYYVWYLGWRECRGLRGREHTDPVVREFLQKRHHDDLQTLTLEVTKEKIKIFQQVEKKKNKTEKVNYPPIPSKDVTFASQLDSPDDDVVVCIYLGYNPQTRSAVHVHVYRCDCADTAVTFVSQLNYLINLPEHQQRINKIEADLIQQGQIVPVRNNNNTTVSLTSSGHSTRSSGSSHSDPRDPDLDKDIEKDLPTPFTSVTEELKLKLKDKTSAPLLLPPKDYDTLNLKHGRVENAFLKKSLNVDIVGEAGGVWGDAVENDRTNNTNNATSANTNEYNSKRSSQNSNGDLPSPSSDRIPQFKASLEERFRNSVNLQNGKEQRLSGPRSNSTASSPSSTLARDPFHSPRGSHHSSPQGTLDSRLRDNGYMSPRSPSMPHHPGFQNGHHMLKRMPSDEGYSSVHDREYPPVFYYPDGYPRDRIPSSPRSSSRGGSREDIRRSREYIPPTSPYPYPSGPGMSHGGHPDLTQSLPEKVLREYYAREEAKHSKDKSKKSDKKDKKGKDKLKINHARSHSEEVVPIPQPDYDITLRVPNKPVARVSSLNYR